MHNIQEKLLQLADKKNLASITLREMGELIGERGSPQKIKHHLFQLEKNGLIRVDKIRGLIQRIEPGWVKGFAKEARLLSIPILGSASCGPAELFAEQNIQGYLRVSDTLLGRKRAGSFYALKARGLSMNRVDVGGKNIEDGDYLIVDNDIRSPDNGDVVVSVIDGMANIKRFIMDRANKQIALISESTKELSPIYIHEGDDYFVNGRVIQVIKKPKDQ